MKFSIITCTYNSKKYIENNIKSVYSQNFLDFEHIFIDSFSTDGTVEIIKDYKNKFPEKVKFFQVEKKGISNAMNEGIKRASGEYIIHLHSDDSFFDNDVLADVDRFSANGQYDWIYGKINVVEESGKSTGTFPNKKIYQGGSSSWFGKKILNYYNYIPHQAVFIKRGVFQKFGYFDEKLSSAMDPDFWFRIKDKTNWSFFDRIISNYCIHSESESANIANRKKTIDNKKEVRSRYLNSFEKVLATVIDYLVELKNSNYR